MRRQLSHVLTRSQAGYSLLEVIVVVAILGLAATLSTPSLLRMIAAQQAQQVVRGLVTEFGVLRAEAFIQNTALTAEALEERLSRAAPADWTLQVDDTVRLSGNGYCTAGAITVRSPSSRSWIIQVSEGGCELGNAVGA